LKLRLLSTIQPLPNYVIGEQIRDLSSLYSASMERVRQYNGTEIEIASKLVDLGIPKEDIVLAFHEPFVRQYTGFAVS
jgi:hypothetical protein